MVTTAEKREKLTPARILCAGLAEIIYAISEGRRKPADVARQLHKLAEFAEGIAPKQSSTPPTTYDDENDIYLHWREASGKKAAKFTAQRREKVRARLADGYSISKIKQAIDFVCNDPWYTGGNDKGVSYTDLELICRNATKLEQFAERAQQAGIKEPESKEDPGKTEALKRAQEDAKDALDKGDTDAYNRAQERIKRIRKQ